MFDAVTVLLGRLYTGVEIAPYLQAFQLLRPVVRVDHRPATMYATVWVYLERQMTREELNPLIDTLRMIEGIFCVVPGAIDPDHIAYEILAWSAAVRLAPGLAILTGHSAYPGPSPCER